MDEFVRGLIWRLCGPFMLALAWTSVSAQSTYSDAKSPVQGVFEQYLETDPSHRGVLGTLSYLEAEAHLSPSFRIVGSATSTPDWNWMDELYGEYSFGSDLFKFGRFRSPFGFNDWSDMYYTPFIGLPMIRGYWTNIVPNRPINRQDSGVEFDGGRGPFQYQISLVDSGLSDWQSAPKVVDTGVGRVQISGGQVMVGLDGFAKASNSHSGPAEQIAGLDFRWTAPRIEVRGEAVKGFGPQGTKGFYADLMYRPPGLARTQVGARVQGVDEFVQSSWGSGEYSTSALRLNAMDESGWWRPTSRSMGTLYTLGARQFLNENFTLSVNYGQGNNIPLATGLRGWSVQLQSTFRF